MKKARQSSTVIDGITFTTIRPTTMQALKHYEAIKESNENAMVEILNFTVDCTVDMKATEKQLLSEGSDELIPFDKEVLVEFFNDRTDVLQNVYEHISTQLEKYNQKIEDNKKK